MKIHVIVGEKLDNMQMLRAMNIRIAMDGTYCLIKVVLVFIFEL
jgi:hypothetical protein